MNSRRSLFWTCLWPRLALAAYFSAVGFLGGGGDAEAYHVLGMHMKKVWAEGHADLEVTLMETGWSDPAPFDANYTALARHAVEPELGIVFFNWTSIIYLHAALYRIWAVPFIFVALTAWLSAWANARFMRGYGFERHVGWFAYSPVSIFFSAVHLKESIVESLVLLAAVFWFREGKVVRAASAGLGLAVFRLLYLPLLILVFAGRLLRRVSTRAMLTGAFLMLIVLPPFYWNYPYGETGPIYSLLYANVWTRKSITTLFGLLQPLPFVVWTDVYTSMFYTVYGLFYLTVLAGLSSWVISTRVSHPLVTTPLLVNLLIAYYTQASPATKGRYFAPFLPLMVAGFLLIRPQLRVAIRRLLNLNRRPSITIARGAFSAVLLAVVVATAAVAQNTPPLHVHTENPDDLVIADFARKTESGEIQSIVSIRTAQTLIPESASDRRGTIRLIDPAKRSELQAMEIGFYRWGAGIFTENLFEFFTAGVSLRSLRDAPSFLAVRDFYDVKDLRLLHDGRRGVITTTGVDPGGISVEANGPLSLQSMSGDVSLTADASLAIEALTGNVTVHTRSADGEVHIGAGAQHVVRVDSRGSLHVPGEIYYRGEPIGEAEPPPPAPVFEPIVPSSSHFGVLGGANAGWEVEPQDVVTYGYARTGQIATVWFLIALSTVSGSPSILTISLPENVRPAVQAETLCHVSDNHQDYQVLPCLVARGERFIRVYRRSYAGSWPVTTNKTSVRGTLTFPVLP